MELYYSCGACALHVNIVANELGVSLHLLEVDLGTKQVQDGRSLMDINPKGQIPVLITDHGELLTEGLAISLYLIDTADNRESAKRMLPTVGTMAHYRTFEVAHYISAELHKGFAPLFTDSEELCQAHARIGINKGMDELNRQLEGKAYLTGSTFTFADAYAFNVLTWAEPCGFDLTKWQNLYRFYLNVLERDSVRKALLMEGLKPGVAA